MLQREPPIALGQFGHGEQGASVAAHSTPLSLAHAILTGLILADCCEVGTVTGYGFARSLTDESLFALSVLKRRTLTFLAANQPMYFSMTEASHSLI